MSTKISSTGRPNSISIVCSPSPPAPEAQQNSNRNQSKITGKKEQPGMVKEALPCDVVSASQHFY